MAGEFRARLANGLSKLSRSIGGPPQRSRVPGTMSLDVNSTKLTLEEALPGFSQPVWGPETNTVGAFSREGYTTQTFDTPIMPFKTQVLGMATDEDIQLAINHLTSEITGGAHYWKGCNEMVTEYIENFSSEIDFDWFDTILIKELLAYGNSVWKPRMGVQFIRNADDLMHIPISSFVRIWWDRQRIPYKLEFRGSEYQGYHNPDDVLHFKWNPIDASAFGNGFLTSLTAPREFTQITTNGPVTLKLPSLLDRKYSTAHTMHISERRYVPHNVYVAEGADDDERASMQADLADLRPGEDFVVGSKVDPIELGSAQRAFDPTLFSDLTQGAIFKALNDFMGKQGSAESHQYANAEQSALLTQIGLASFPLAVARQLQEKLFKPWYMMNPIYDPSYGGGMVAIPWEICEFELNFGQVEKKDIDLEDQIRLIELGTQTGGITDPMEIRKLLEDAGLGLRQEVTNQMNMMYNDPMNQMALSGVGAIPPQGLDFGGVGGGPINWDNQNAGSPPNDSAIYTDMAVSPRPTDPRLNFTKK